MLLELDLLHCTSRGLSFQVPLQLVHTVDGLELLEVTDEDDVGQRVEFSERHLQLLPHLSVNLRDLVEDDQIEVAKPAGGDVLFISVPGDLEGGMHCLHRDVQVWRDSLPVGSHQQSNGPEEQHFATSCGSLDCRFQNHFCLAGARASGDLQQPAGDADVVGVHDGSSRFHGVQDCLLLRGPQPPGAFEDAAGAPSCWVCFVAPHGLQKQCATQNACVEGPDAGLLQTTELQFRHDCFQELCGVVSEIPFHDVAEVLTVLWHCVRLRVHQVLFFGAL